MRRWIAVMALVPVVSSCGEEAPLEPAEFAELCGVAGPVQLFALEPGMEVSRVPSTLADRHLFLVSPPFTEPDWLQRRELWLTGPCGESPRRLAEDVRWASTRLEWPDVLLVCSEKTRQIVSLDPAGAEPPHVVFTDVDCAARWTPHGLVSVGDEEHPHPLTLHPLPDDPRSETSEPRVLLDPLPVVDPAVVRLSSVQILPDKVFLLDEHDALLRVDLADGAVTTEQTGVREFDVSFDGRYLVWQDIESTSDNPEYPTGMVYFRDLSTGEGMSLAETWLAYTLFPFLKADQGFMELTRPNGANRVYSLPGLDFVDLPRYLDLERRLADGRWLLQSWGGGTLYIADLEDVAARTPLWVDGDFVDIQSDGALIQDMAICCGKPDADLDEGAVWFVPFDASPPQRLTGDLARGVVKVDVRRLMANVDVDDARLGKLVTVDIETGEERLVDEQVKFNTFSAAWQIDEHTRWYVVDDGERSGVWAVRLPPT